MEILQSFVRNLSSDGHLQSGTIFKSLMTFFEKRDVFIIGRTTPRILFFSLLFLTCHILQWFVYSRDSLMCSFLNLTQLLILMATTYMPLLVNFLMYSRKRNAMITDLCIFLFGHKTPYQHTWEFFLGDASLLKSLQTQSSLLYLVFLYLGMNLSHFMSLLNESTANSFQFWLLVFLELQTAWLFCYTLHENVCSVSFQLLFMFSFISSSLSLLFAASKPVETILWTVSFFSCLKYFLMILSYLKFSGDSKSVVDADLEKKKHTTELKRLLTKVQDEAQVLEFIEKEIQDPFTHRAIRKNDFSSYKSIQLVIFIFLCELMRVFWKNSFHSSSVGVEDAWFILFLSFQLAFFHFKKQFSYYAGSFTQRTFFGVLAEFEVLQWIFTWFGASSPWFFLNHLFLEYFHLSQVLFFVGFFVLSHRFQRICEFQVPRTSNSAIFREFLILHPVLCLFLISFIPLSLKNWIFLSLVVLMLWFVYSYWKSVQSQLTEEEKARREQESYEQVRVLPEEDIFGDRDEKHED